MYFFFNHIISILKLWTKYKVKSRQKKAISTTLKKGFADFEAENKELHKFDKGADLSCSYEELD